MSLYDRLPGPSPRRTARLPALSDAAYKPRVNGSGAAGFDHRETDVTAIYLIVGFIAFFAVLNLVEKGRMD